MRTVLLVLLLSGIASSVGAQGIRHRFLAVDESRTQLLYVDQKNPSRDWAMKLPGRCRDIQLVGHGLVMVSTPDGFCEYRLADQTLVREVKGFAGACAARRQRDGRTILACNQGGITIYDLDPEGKTLRKVSFPPAQTRLVRLTPQDTLLFGSGDRLFEGDWKGNLLRTVTLGQGFWVYQALRRPNGNTLVAGGYNPCVVELDAQGKVVRTLGGKAAPETKGFGYYFFSGMQVLPEGDLVVCNWTGHDPHDSSKGTQILEFSPSGRVVWSWHDPERAGSIHAVIILDDLDTEELCDDVSSVLKPLWRE